jgi:NhaP-type Na+/H+ or K+/H+ antiporter
VRVDILVPSAVVLALCCVSGLADAQGFVHASRMWRADRFIWVELGKSATGFCVGIGLYWLSVRFMGRLGIGAPEVQTMMWFAVTTIGVAMGSGRFGRWPALDQMVAGGVILGLGWLLIRSRTVQ